MLALKVLYQIYIRVSLWKWVDSSSTGGAGCDRCVVSQACCATDGAGCGVVGAACDIPGVLQRGMRCQRLERCASPRASARGCGCVLTRLGQRVKHRRMRGSKVCTAQVASIQTYHCPRVPPLFTRGTLYLRGGTPGGYSGGYRADLDTIVNFSQHSGSLNFFF